MPVLQRGHQPWPAEFALAIAFRHEAHVKVSRSSECPWASSVS